ncbi:BTAD domain-containing putative transcriptional regulator [Nakamurella sp. GG22]
MLRLTVLGALGATLSAGDGDPMSANSVLAGPASASPVPASPVPASPAPADPVPADLGGPRQRSVLALLLVARGQVVSVDRLVEDLWQGEAPPQAIGALQAYVSHLRRALEPDRAPRTPATVLVSEPPGYAIRVPTNAVDAWRFEALVRSAAEQPGTASERELLDEALALWRGDAFGEFAAEPWAEPEAARLEGLRVVATERWCEAVLRSGDAHEAVMAAEELTRAHPLREEGWRLLAMGLYAGGRQADALQALRRARARLAEELGVDPGPALLKVEADVLAQRLVLPERHRTRSPADRPALVDGGGPKAPAPSATRPGPADDRDRVEFVGRDTELNTLHSVAAEAIEKSESRVVLLAGEPGAGKSRLADRFGRELAADRWRVIVGRCPESAGAPPAWPWVEALRHLAADVDPGGLTAALAPLLDEGAAPREADASFGRFLLSRAVTSYVSTASHGQPLAVLLDDLHRADSETLALVEAVASSATGPLLLVAAYRPADAPAQLGDTLARLAALSPTRLSLGGFDPAQAARLVRAVVGVQPDPATLSALIDRTGGNPFYLTESARLLGSEGDLVARSKVPEGVRDVLRRRFARLPEVSVSVLRLAAVVGRDVDIDVLVRAAEADEETVLDALEAGVLAGLLTEPAPGAVRFAHVLVRDTLYDDAPRLRRSRWHARVGAALAELHPEEFAALAHHFHQAGTTATARPAVDAAVRAADQAVSRYAHETAASLYAQALADLDRVPTADGGSDEVGERVEILARLNLSQIAGGDSMAAPESRREAIRLADRDGRPALLVRVLTAWDLPTPWIVRRYGMVDTEITTLIERALSWSETDVVDDVVRCKLLCALVAEISGEQVDRAVAAAREAEQIARGLGEPVLIGLALHARSWVTAADENPDHRRLLGAELQEIGEHPGLAVFALLGHHMELQYRAVVLDVDGISQEIEQLDAIVRRYHWRQAESAVQIHRAFLAHLTGRLEEAESGYLRAHELFRSSGALDADGITALALLTVRLTQQREGELATVVGGVDTATDMVADLRALPLSAVGRTAEARELRLRIRPVRDDFFRCLVLTMRAMIAVRLADPVEGESVYQGLLTYRGQVGGAGTGSFTVGPVDTALGDLAAMLGRPAQAREHFAVALDVARRCGNQAWIDRAGLRLAELADDSGLSARR